MSDQNNGGNDGYFDLLDSYSGISSTPRSSSDNKGNVSFSGTQSRNRTTQQPSADRSNAPTRSFQRPVQSPSTRPAQRPASPYGTSSSAERRVVAPKTGSTQRPGKPAPVRAAAPRPAAPKKKLTKKQRRRRQKLKNFIQSLSAVFIAIIVVILASLLLKKPIMGCVSDLVGIERSSNAQRVMIEDGMTIDEIIDMLKEKDLIYSSMFCKFATDFLKYDKQKKYSNGSYDLSPDMGIETMLNTIISAGEKLNTVTITFPEGLTVDQIIEKLAENKVCTAEKMYEAMNNEELFTTYSFLEEIKSSTGRARMLEGYLAPDTYEFYIGEDPKSVLNKFLDNFKNRWSDSYTEKANELGLTVDQIVTVASILEKEGNDAKQMKLIASILYNRRNSPYFSYINCDSTQFYVDSFKDKVDADTYEAISQNYDTYRTTGFPLGAICNPGVSALEAALNPDTSEYFYFLHDASGNMYVARTETEHNSNMQYLN